MKQEISWDCKKEDYELISKIANRAIKEYKAIIKMDLNMDITAVHCNGNKMDLEKLLNADDFNFFHDIFGIMKNIDRKTGKLTNHFLPRCSTN